MISLAPINKIPPFTGLMKEIVGKSRINYVADGHKWTAIRQANTNAKVKVLMICSDSLDMGAYLVMGSQGGIWIKTID